MGFSKEELNKSKMAHDMLNGLLQMMHDGAEEGRFQHETGILLSFDKVMTRLNRIQGTCLDKDVPDEEIKSHYEYLNMVIAGLDSYIEAHQIKDYAAEKGEQE